MRESGFILSKDDVAHYASRASCAALCCLFALLLSSVPLLAQTEPSTSAGAQRTVVLLHGLGRSSRSMSDMAEALTNAGYKVENIDYPSTDYPFEELLQIVSEEIDRCCSGEEAGLNFVTHSLGGILVRAYAKEKGAGAIRRAVMLSPPSRGTELVDELKGITLYQWITGPTGQQLGTDQDSVPLKLGPVEFEVGVITGTATINPINSWLIPGPDDGKVSVDRAKVSGMTDFLALPYSHPFIMSSDEVIRQTVFFLRHGRFEH